MPRCKWCGKEESEHQHDYFKSCFGPMDSRNTHYEPMPNPSRKEIEAPLRAEIERKDAALSDARQELMMAMRLNPAADNNRCLRKINAALAPSAPEPREPREQGGEIDEALKHFAPGSVHYIGDGLVGDKTELQWCLHYGAILARALLARESAEPAEERGQRIRCNHCMSEFDEDRIDVDALGPDSGETCPVCSKGDALMDLPAEERGPEVGALLWMAEHVMGTDAARTMRGWLDRFRAEGRLVVRDAAGLEIAQYPEEGDR